MANTIKLGNGNWATKEGSLLAYNDENNNFKPLPFTTTRASSATVVNKQGLIETVGSGIPRIDFSDDANGALLLENSSTNLITYSEDFTQVSFYDLINDVTVETSAIISPRGTTGVQELRENIDLDDHLIKSVVTFTETDSSFSIFAKYKGNNRNIKLSLGSGKYASFDLQNGTYFDVQTSTVAKIESYSNGWYRCSINGSISVSKLNIILLNNTTEIYQGDGASGVYIWGSQFEQGSYATSYIPTQGSAQTRVADTASGSGNSTVINSSEGVLYAEISALGDAPTRVITIGDGTSNNRVQLYYDSSNILNGNVVNVGGQVTGFSYNGDSNTFNKVALKYKVNDFSFWVNGVKIAVDTNGLTPVGLNELTLDNGTGSGNFYGKVKSLQVYTTALSDAELATLTTI